MRVCHSSLLMAIEYKAGAGRLEVAQGTGASVRFEVIN